MLLLESIKAQLTSKSTTCFYGICKVSDCNTYLNIDTVIGVPAMKVKITVIKKMPRNIGKFAHRVSHFPALASKSILSAVGVISIFLSIQEQL